ncbi:MAG: translation initiation factor IF-3 [Candidatus Abawacabacteria bacterium]|nr:translation initiation factor IF-3 [Candidatus Abawacabacteria bacterium]
MGHVEVRLVDSENELIGIVPLPKALSLAQEAGLDLVEIAPMAKPPVCKIMDFGKYIYRQQKLEKKQKSKSPKNEIKGIRLGLTTSPHDLETKANQTKRFLEKNAKVKVTLMFHGRQMSRKELGEAKVNEFLTYLEGLYTIEQGITLQGKLMSMMIKPL